MFEGGKQGGFEVKLEERPTMKSCDRASNNINQSQKLFIDIFDMCEF